MSDAVIQGRAQLEQSSLQVAEQSEEAAIEEAMAGAIPVVGALGGAALNAAFTDYFSRAARYHFGLRALENKHGRSAVESYYTQIKATEKPGVKSL